MTARNPAEDAAGFSVLAGEKFDMAVRIDLDRSRGYNVRLLRGGRMTTLQGLFNEISAALQFPYYFGSNWPALDECLSDLEWIDTAEDISLFIADADQVLIDEPPVELQVFARILAGMRASYAEPINLGETWDRPAVRVRFVLHVEIDRAKELYDRWGTSVSGPNANS